MKTLVCFLALLALAAGSISEARADGRLTAARELAEWALRKFTGKAATEGAEALSQRIIVASARYGDDAVRLAVTKAGPAAISLADDAGQAAAPAVLRFLARHGAEGAAVITSRGAKLLTLGDEAALALVRHAGTAEPLLERFGATGARALASMTPRAGRRVAMLSRDLLAGQHADGVMAVMARHGQKAADFIWDHKGALAATATMAAFVANPEPFIDGTVELTRTVAETAVKPTVVAAGNMVHEAAVFARWALTILAVALGVGLWLAVRKGGTGALKLGLAAARRMVG